MTAIEAKREILKGTHWLCRLALELDLGLVSEMERRDLWQREEGEIALELIRIHAKSEGKTQGAKFTVRCFPWEKNRILRAAGGEKVEDWIRKALIEKAYSPES